MEKTTGLYAWHVHHDVLVECLTEPIEDRQDYIRFNKPEEEVGTRLRLLRLVLDQEAIASAQRAYEEAMVPALRTYEEAIAPAQRTYYEAIASAQCTYRKAIAPAQRTYYEAIASARRARDEVTVPARSKYDEATAAVHARECLDCPWNGNSIFPEGS